MPQPVETITSLQNRRVKDVARLRDRRGRNKQSRIVIDGVREIRLALSAGVPVAELFYCPALLDDEARALLDSPPAEAVERFEVTSDVFGKLAFGARSEGIVAVADVPERSLAELQLPANPLVAVLEGIEKPGNVGAIARSADGAGVSALVVADGVTDLYNPNAIRASLGAIFTLPVCSAPGEATRAWLRASGLRVYAARVDATKLHTEVDFRGPTAIVLGSEADGLTQAWHADDILPIRLPMAGAADSLNVSAAAAVLFYEAVRQRSQK